MVFCCGSQDAEKGVSHLLPESGDSSSVSESQDCAELKYVDAARIVV